jgi:hypothetical protein
VVLLGLFGSWRVNGVNREEWVVVEESCRAFVHVTDYSHGWALLRAGLAPLSGVVGKPNQRGHGRILECVPAIGSRAITSPPSETLLAINVVHSVTRE